MRSVWKLVAVFVILFVFAALSVVAVLLELGRSRPLVESIEQRQVVEGMPVNVSSPVPMSFTEYIYCDGAVVADVRAMLRAKVEEVVEAVHARVGEPVAKGQVLVEFRREDLTAAVQAAETAFAEAESNLTRYTSLAEQQVIAADRLEQVRTAREAAAAALESARSRLGFAGVASPIDGYVEERWVEPGEHKGVGNELLSVVDLSAVEVRALVLDEDVAAISVGAEAEFQTEACGAWLTGRVDRVSPVSNDPNRFFEVFLKVENRCVDGNWVMRPGTYAEVRFVRRVLPDALGIPASTVTYEGNDRAVYIVEEGTARVPDLDALRKAEEPGFGRSIERGFARVKAMFDKSDDSNPTDGFTKEVTGNVARRVVIRPGLSAGDFVQISDSGIDADTAVIVNPRDDMKDGSLLRVLEGGEGG